MGSLISNVLYMLLLSCSAEKDGVFLKAWFAEVGLLM